MRYLLDTNIVIEGVAGSDPAVKALQTAVESEWVGYSAITRLELFGYPDLTTEEERALSVTIEQFEDVAVTHSIIDHAIQLRRTNRIKVPDAIIAATAVVMDAALITRNENDFKVIEELQVFNPWQT